MLESPESLKAFESKVGQKWAKEIIIDYYSRSTAMMIDIKIIIVIINMISIMTIIMIMMLIMILIIMIRTEEGWLLGPMVKILTIMAKQNPTPGGLSR